MENGITNDESKAIGKFIEDTSKLNIPVVSNFVCFCGEKAKYRYIFKELDKEIHRCEKHKANDC